MPQYEPDKDKTDSEKKSQSAPESLVNQKAASIPTYSMVGGSPLPQQRAGELLTAFWNSVSPKKVRMKPVSLRGEVDFSDADDAAREALSRLLLRALRIVEDFDLAADLEGREREDGLIGMPRARREAQTTPPDGLPRDIAPSQPDAPYPGAAAQASGSGGPAARETPDAETLGLPPAFQNLPFDEGVVDAIFALRRNLPAPGRAAQLLVHHIGPFLERHRAQHSVSGEDFVDGSVRILALLAEAPRLREGIARIVPMLRRSLGGGLAPQYCATDTKSPFSRGEIVSLGAIATLLANSIDGQRNLEAEKLSIVYYHEVLLEIAKLGTLNDQGDLILRKVIEQAANNIAAAFGRVERVQPASDRSAFLAVIRDLVMLSTSISEAEGVNPNDALAPTSAQLGLSEQIEIAGKGYGISDWFPRLSSAELVSIDEGTDGAHPYLISWRHAAAGVLRAANRMGGRASVGLFNAGVQLLRMPAPQRNADLRMLLNAIGLHFAYALAEDDNQALNEYEGSDCLVNLLGALDSWLESADTDLPMPVIQGLVAASAPIIKDSRVQGRDRGRMENSLLSIGKELNRRNLGPEGAAQPLPGAIAAFLVAMGSRFETPLFGELTVERLALLLRRAFEARLGAYIEEIRARFDWASQSQDILGDYMKDYLAALLAHAEDPLAELRAIYSERRYPGASAVIGEIGPLQAAGLTDAVGWDDLCWRAFGGRGSTDLGVAFTEGFSPFLRLGAAVAAPAGDAGLAATPGPLAAALPALDPDSLAQSPEDSAALRAFSEALEHLAAAREGGRGSPPRSGRDLMEEDADGE